MENTRSSRARWAAVGAAVAVSLGAGGVGVGRAVLDTAERAVFVPITPCRLVDTRADSAVGPRTAPLAAGDTMTVQAIGPNGQCTISDGATALSLNVTAVGATESTFLTIFPQGVGMPLASHLNPVPGNAPTPNEVPVDLGLTGAFNVFNRLGSVDVIIDVVGYFEDHNHDDRYYTKIQSDSVLATKAEAGTSYTKDEIDSQLTTKADAGVSYTKDETDGAITAAVAATGVTAVVSPTVSSLTLTSTEVPSTLAIVNTDLAGTLFVTRTSSIGMVCESGVAMAYLTVDGVPVANSVRVITATQTPNTFTGVSQPLDAGQHAIGVALECEGPGIPSFASVGSSGGVSALLLPS